MQLRERRSKLLWSVELNPVTTALALLVLVGPSCATLEPPDPADFAIDTEPEPPLQSDALRPHFAPTYRNGDSFAVEVKTSVSARAAAEFDFRLEARADCVVSRQPEVGLVRTCPHFEGQALREEFSRPLTEDELAELFSIRPLVGVPSPGTDGGLPAGFEWSVETPLDLEVAPELQIQGERTDQYRYLGADCSRAEFGCRAVFRHESHWSGRAFAAPDEPRAGASGRSVRLLWVDRETEWIVREVIDVREVVVRESQTSTTTSRWKFERVFR